MSEPIANVDMANAWDGEEGDQWTQFADEYDPSVRSIWARFLETDPIAPADRVLDIGCGSGKSTRDAARLARDGSAVGVDLAPSVVAEALGGRRWGSTCPRRCWPKLGGGPALKASRTSSSSGPTRKCTPSIPRPSTLRSA